MFAFRLVLDGDVSKPLAVESMLRAAFLKAELEFLKSDTSFVRAMEGVKTLADFERLADLAEHLLGAKGRASQAAQQFRQSRKGDQQALPPA